MEPLDAVVKLDAKGCEIWAGDQFQTVDQANAARVAGLKPEQVRINTLYAGGSFGRRANVVSDYIVEAVSIAKALGANGVPVKLQWTREDDIQGGRYRPAYVHKFEAALDARGALTGWRHRIVGQSIAEGTPFEPVMVKDGVDATSVEGAANLPYAIPNLSVELTTARTGVPVLWWRVVGSSHTAYAVEAFIDEVAAAAGKDPFAFRQALLAHSPRHKAVLEIAAKAAGWGEPLPKGRGRGIAVAVAFGTYVAQVAEVTVADGKIKVDRVVCAVDCGVPINPDIITAQMEGGIGFGLGAALYGAITLEGRRSRAEQLRRLSGAAHRRHAEGRGAYRAVSRAADRGRRTRRRPDRPGGRQCGLRSDRQAPARAAVRRLQRRLTRSGETKKRAAMTRRSSLKNLRRNQATRSKRSRSITLLHAATKSFANFSFESAHA